MKKLEIKYTTLQKEKLKKFLKGYNRSKGKNYKLEDFSLFSKQLKLKFPEINTEIIVPVETLKYANMAAKLLTTDNLKNIMKMDKRYSDLKTLRNLWSLKNLDEIIKKKLNINKEEIKKLEKEINKLYIQYFNIINKIDNKISGKIINEAIEIEEKNKRKTKNNLKKLEVLNKLRRNFIKEYKNLFEYEKMPDWEKKDIKEKLKDKNFIDRILKNKEFYYHNYKDTSLRKEPLYRDNDIYIRNLKDELYELSKNKRKNKKEIEKITKEIDEAYEAEERKLNRFYKILINDHIKKFKNKIIKKELFNGYLGGIEEKFYIKNKIEAYYNPIDYYDKLNDKIKYPYVEYSNNKYNEYIRWTYDLPKTWTINTDSKLGIVYSNILGGEYKKQFKQTLKNNKEFLKIVNKLNSSNSKMETYQKLTSNEQLKDTIKEELNKILKEYEYRNELRSLGLG